MSEERAIADGHPRFGTSRVIGRHGAPRPHTAREKAKAILGDVADPADVKGAARKAKTVGR